MPDPTTTRVQIDQLRGSIDDLTAKLLEVINARAIAAVAIGNRKHSLGLPIRDRKREEELLDRIIAENRGPLDDPTLRKLFQEIIDAGVALSSADQGSDLRVAASSGPRVTVCAAGHTLGGDSLQYIAGPCSVESEEQMEQAAAGLSKAGVSFLRGGTFKPRTSPYSFQGLKERGLQILRDTARRHDMASVTESTSVSNIELVAKYADIIQIGARNMANYELLRAAGRTGMPVLLKRGFGATLDEWLNAAEYVAVSGSRDIVLCERGIRTFVRDTRNTLDLSVVPLALERTRLPVMVDVSHAAGRRDILAPLATAGFAAGACAVMIEVHPDPDAALSDSEQQITIEDFCALRQTVVDALTRAARSLRGQSVLREQRKVEAKSAAQRTV